MHIGWRIYFIMPIKEQYYRFEWIRVIGVWSNMITYLTRKSMMHRLNRAAVKEHRELKRLLKRNLFYYYAS